MDKSEKGNKKKYISMYIIKKKSQIATYDFEELINVS